MKKLLSVLLCGVIILSFAGCLNNTEGQNSASNVTLEWWYRGNGIQRDTKMVESKVNEMLKGYQDLENVSVHLNCYNASDYANAVVLAQSAGKQIDILNTVGLSFSKEVRNGSFLDISEYVEKADKLKEALPDWLWDFAKVDGKTYIVPNYQRATNMSYLLTPNKYLEGYDKKDELSRILADSNSSVQTIAKAMEDYLLFVRETEGESKYLHPLPYYYRSNVGLTDFYDNVTPEFVVFNGTGKVVNKFMTEKSLESYAIAAEWYKKGYFPSNILTIKLTDYEGKNMLNPISNVFCINNSIGSKEVVSDSYTNMYQFDIQALPIKDNVYITNEWVAGGNGVYAYSKAPDEAMKFIEMLTVPEGKEIYNTLVYGIEGKHYEKIDDTHIKTLEYDSTQSGIDTSYGAMKWIMGNTFNAYLNQGCLDGENELALEINNSKDTVVSDLRGFYANVDNIATELEQMTAVTSEYKQALECGVKGDDWENYYAEFEHKMKLAGYDKVVAELERQIQEFKANK